jgi:hypothetical protein
LDKHEGFGSAMISSANTPLTPFMVKESIIEERDEKNEIP